MSVSDPSSNPLLPRPPAPRVKRLRPVHRPLPFVTARVVTALILREMTSTYGRKPGGYLWAVLEPVAGIALMSWVFSLALRKPQLGTDFMMFYATGMMPFWVVTQVSARVSQSLRYSRQLLTYPRVTVLDALVARYVLNIMLLLLVSYLVIGGTRLVKDTGTMVDLPRVMLGFAMAASLAAGIGSLNCVLMTAFPLYGTFWGIATRPLMILSGVILMVDGLPRPYRSWLLWNPIVHVVAEVRAGFYFGYHPSFVSPVYVFGVSMVLLVAGILFTWRFHREALEP